MSQKRAQVRRFRQKGSGQEDKSCFRSLERYPDWPRFRFQQYCFAPKSRDMESLWSAVVCEGRIHTDSVDLALVYQPRNRILVPAWEVK